MNERIKLLAEQAVLDSLFESIDPSFTVGTGNGKMTIPLVFADKFAELIVRECAITVIDRCEMRNAEDVKRAEYHAKRIKQHFGVEL